MNQPYSEQFVTPIRKRMETLKGAVEQDLPKLEEGLMELSFRQVFDMAGGLDTALAAYQSATQPLHRGSRRSASPGSSGGPSYYQRRRAQTEQITKLAQEAIERQGYVVAASIATGSRYRETTVNKVLEGLADQYGWDRRRDRETKSTRYVARPPTEQKPPADAQSASPPSA